IVVRTVAVGTVGRDRARTSEGTRPDHHQAAARAATAHRAAGVVARAAATATAEDRQISCSRKSRAAKSADRQIRIPAISSQSTRAAVTAAATTRVLIVARWMTVSSAAARVTWRASGRAAVGITFNTCIQNCGGRGIVDITWRAGYALTFSTMKSVAREV